MEKNQRTLMIPFISAEDLERVSNKMKVYASVFISGSGKQKTAVDKDGDTNPTWNGQITFNLDKESAVAQILVFELHCSEPNGGDKDIGEVFVRVKDLMSSMEGSLTYHVQTPSGNPKGKLYFIYEWEGEKVAGAVLSTPPPVMAATSFTARYPPPVMGPPLYGAAVATAGQYNAPYPHPAMVIGPPPPGYWYGYGQAEPAKKNEVGTIGGLVGRVFAGVAISDILNNVSGNLGF